MSTPLSTEVIELLNDASTIKVLATIDGEGSPHAVVRNELYAAGDGTLILPELLESSPTNRNLLRSLWFDRNVAVSLLAGDGRSFQIKGKALKTHVSGALFQRHYVEARERQGNVGLAAVWVIEPEEAWSEDFGHLRALQEAERPTLTHLDQLAK
ncbi:pyridoxamine 5'-phosphate oxidase family protein [Azoarcus sp. DN11]|uniref:pyridoxamine 5'-phosphate oxidase family protein n=1 Tax=Azoarcus sp. DN11 TaxID=356837 RepID=UPI000EB41913|nr:pyridoxamine 5'-phosphate oxidase family protein [Azoarcus sp. DN11]AYH45570.1 hypothetical protein CDA09_19670 [Azoarcus sp. DN11]